MSKGTFNGVCNMSSCKTGNPATWYNHGSYAYYCKSCAMRLNADPYNARDAQRSFGHALCTPGEKVEKELEQPSEGLVIRENIVPDTYKIPQYKPVNKILHSVHMDEYIDDLKNGMHEFRFERATSQVFVKGETEAIAVEKFETEHTFDGVRPVRDVDYKVTQIR